ncbi:Lrp/AsnC ligand binding domain-containing protein [Halobacteria archaeon AArc-dxtr1]|nr:Lrp/AsnC ligand binding domain-containing protein [Halobacteria archaeon AArc-dxtr1]
MVEAYLLMMTAAGTSQSVLANLREIEGVERANIVAGEFDIIATVEAGSTQDLLTVVTEEIHSLEGAGPTRTSMVLQ